MHAVATSRRTIAPWLLAVAAVTFAVVAIATRFGTGISTDSVAYIAEARQLRDGRVSTLPAGLVEIYDGVQATQADDVDPGRDAVPSAHFPPLYPAVLAATGLTGDGASARWLNALLLALSAVFVAVMVQRYTASRVTAVVAAAVVVLAPPVLRVHAMAWSEPLFMALVLGGLLALATFLEDGRKSMLVAAAVCLGAAWLTRHIGAALVVAALVVVLRYRRRSAATFLVFSALPMALYLAAIALVDAGGHGYTLDPHWPGPFDEGLRTLRNWFAPVPVVVVVPLGIFLYLVSRPFPLASPDQADRHLPQLPVLLGACLITYSCFVLSSLFLVAEYIPLEERLAVPAYAMAVVLVACVLRFRGGLALIVALFAGWTAVAGAALIWTGARDYPGFAARPWRDSEAMQEVRSLPASMRIYSNFPDAIYFRTGRNAHLVPRRAESAPFVDDVRSGRGVVILFTIGHRDGVPGPSELTAALDLSPNATLLDALIYQARSAP